MFDLISTLILILLDEHVINAWFDLYFGDDAITSSPLDHVVGPFKDTIQSTIL